MPFTNPCPVLLLRRLSVMGVCWALSWAFWGSLCVGQGIESPPPSAPPNPFTAPRVAPQPVAANGPIIQGLPGTENQAGNAPAPMFSDPLTLDVVQQRLKAATEDQTLEKSQLELIQGLYQKAVEDLKETAAVEAIVAECIQRTQAVPTQIEEAKKLKQSFGKKAERKPGKNVSLVELQQELATREDDLNKAKNRLDQAVNALKEIASNRGELSQAQKTTQDRLDETEQHLRNLLTNGNVTNQVLAQRSQLRARWQLHKANLERMAKEEACRQARTQLLPLERDIAAWEVSRLESEVQAWRKAVAEERQAALDREKAQAEAQARRALTYKKYPSIAEQANKIVKLAEIRQSTAARIPEVVKQLDQTTNQWETIQDSFKQSRERVEAAGNTMNVGTLLRLQQKKLPNTRELERDIYSRQDEIQIIQLAFYEVNDRATELTNPKLAEELVDSLSPAPTAQERGQLLAFVKELLETEKSHLDNLQKDYDDLLGKLWKLDKVEKQLIEETEEYSQFISEHVLWIRSCDPIWIHSFGDYRSAFWGLLEWNHWGNVLVALGQDFWDHPGPWMIALLMFGVLFIQHHKLKRQIVQIGKTMNKPALTEFRPTLRVLLDTVLLAMIWPALLCWVGHRLSQPLEAPENVSAVGQALFAVGLFYFPVELLRQSCRTKGLVQSHFQWPAPVVTMLRRNLRWFVTIVPALWLIVAIYAAGGSSTAVEHESLGRLCFMLSLLLEALFLHRVLRPSGSAFRALVAEKKGGWVERLRYVFYAAGVLVPVVLASLAAVGYFYTAEKLITRFFVTTMLVLTILILDALIQCWLLIARRRLAMEQLRQRREAARAQAEAEQAAAGGTTSQSPVVPAPQETLDERLDVSAMNEQTRHLIRSLLFVGIVVGLWGVWVDVLPALAILKKVEIQALTIERVIEEPVQTVAETPPPETGVVPASPTEEAPTETPPETKQRTIKVPITLADLMLSLIILIVAIGAARNLPGMLEMIVLQRLPIDNAARYAITTLAQYGFMIFGVSAAFYVVGLRWQNVQWLAAALMVGLGFGLQEIFANFFSGLIVLLERPVRVGDIVTVGNTTGIVTRIRMRASTITNWERQEMIIPNKDLITGTVLNWTLSDTVQRVFIQVGVAYGSDTDSATETLYEVLREHPNVMKEPPPMVTFAGFGDSTLNFEVRCFLPTAAVKLATTHELHTNIDKAFRKAGLEIAFPQCDLHIRSVEEAIPLQQVADNKNGANGHHSTESSALSKGA